MFSATFRRSLTHRRGKAYHVYFHGEKWFMVRPLAADYAILKAHRGDRMGNVVYRMTARNFNPLCGMAGKVTIAEVEEVVEVGSLDPDNIHLPGVFVQRIVAGEGRHENRIERTTITERKEA